VTAYQHTHGAAVTPPAPPPSCPAHTSGEAAVPLAGPRFQTDPAGLYSEMREEHGPVVPVLLPGDVPAWLVIGYQEMYQVTTDPLLFPRDSGLWNQWKTLPRHWPLRSMIGWRQPSVQHTVGKEHRRHREMLQSALEQVSAFELSTYCEEFADRLLDAVCERGEADIIAEYARPLPVLVLARVLGFPDSEGPGLVKAMNDLADDGPEAAAAHEYLAARVHELVANKREFPGADVTSWMLACPDALTDEEYELDVTAVMTAGHLPSADWIGNSIRLMLTDDRFATSFTGGRRSIPEAMNEVLWEDAPTQILAGRWAACETWLGGHRIGKGDMLLLGLAGANCDPKVRTRAARPDAGLRTGNSSHFAFSHGEFECPFQAQEMAATLAQVAIEMMLDRLPAIELAVRADTLVQRPSAFLRGMTALPVQFSPTSPVDGGR
jgi:cytochrome P450